MRILLLAALLAAAAPARALAPLTGTSAAEFLRLGAGARSLGMGEAATAVTEGPDAAYWNPAGLAGLSRPEVLYSRSELPAGVHYDFLALTYPSQYFRGTFAVAVTRLSQEKLAMVDASNQDTGSFAPHSEVYALSYGHQFADNDPLVGARDYFRENWNLPRVDRPYDEEREPWTGEIAAGFTMKSINETLGTRKATAFAVDAGAIYRPSYIHELIIGGALRHFGSRLRFISEAEPVPAEAAASVAYDARVDDWRLLPALEADVPYAGAPYGKLGFEASRAVAPGMSAAARLGWSSRTASELGAVSGLAFGVGLQAGGFRFDAAMAPSSPLGSGLRISAGWKF